MSRYIRSVMSRCALIVTVAGSLGACGDAGLVCTTELRSSLQVDVVDAQSGAPAAAGSIVILQGTALRDSVAAATSPPSLLTAQVWWEDRVGAGTYSVTVRKPTYQDWTQSDIHIVADRCHVTSPVHITASLQRTTP